MKLSAKKILGTGLALGLASLSLFAQSAAPFGNLPLWFEAGTPAKFTAHASGSEFSISPVGAEFTLAKKTGETAACQLRFVGANPAARISGDQKLSGTINYLLGDDAGQWRAGVPTFAQVRVENIYPGVNVVYYGNRQKLEYDFNLAAGVNPSAIALRFDGAEKVSVDAAGGLVISLGSGEVIQHPPVAYQTIRGARQEIAATYKMLDAHTAAFALGAYDRSAPLVIDPVLTYSSYFGGDSGDTAWAIAVNPIDGSIYVAGQTFSTKNTNSPSQTFSTPGAYQTNYHGGKVTGDPLLKMDGKAVFKLAVGVLDEAARAVLAKAGKVAADIDWLIPHQANIRIMQGAARKLKLPMDKVIVTVDQHGNTSAASIPLALDSGIRSGKIKPGELLMLEGVGGGFTWGAVLLNL